MTKIPENKTRKRLRIALWVFYLFEIVLCSMPYYQYIRRQQALFLLCFRDARRPRYRQHHRIADSEFAAASTILPLNFIFVVIPIVGFFSARSTGRAT